MALAGRGGAGHQLRAWPYGLDSGPLALQLALQLAHRDADRAPATQDAAADPARPAQRGRGPSCE
jgi:hypothetical protein